MNRKNLKNIAFENYKLGQKSVKKIYILILICSSLFSFASLHADPTESDECYLMTWFGGSAGKKGKTVKVVRDLTDGSLRYDWKNGLLKPNKWETTGIAGAWIQDDSEGTFSLKGSVLSGPIHGTWSSKGSKLKNKLSFRFCKYPR